MIVVISYFKINLKRRGTTCKRWRVYKVLLFGFIPLFIRYEPLD